MGRMCAGACAGAGCETGGRELLAHSLHVARLAVPCRAQEPEVVAKQLLQMAARGMLHEVGLAAVTMVVQD